MYRYVTLLCFLSVGVSQTKQQCTYTQLIQPGHMFKVNNPRFPRPYPSDTKCSWEAYTVPGSIVEVSCGRVQLAKVSIFGYRKRQALEIKNAQGVCLDHLVIIVNNEASSHCAPFNASGSRVEMMLTATTRWNGYFNCLFKVSNPGQVRPTPPPAPQSPTFSLPPLEPLDPFDPFPPPGAPGPFECDCGWNLKARKAPNTRIVGGEEALIHEFPSMVAFVNRNTRGMWCGGTIIAPTTVLTAAHCVVGRDPVDYALLIGEHDTSQGSEAQTSVVRVAKFISHPDYNAKTQANDLALAMTDHPFAYSQNVGPACLPFHFQASVNQYLTVTGWGLDSFGGELSSVLKKVNLKIVRHEYCSRTYGEYEPDKHICTYERGKDACQYDSGGPLFAYNSENKQFVMGLVSYGRDCGKTDPAVNVNVTSYIDWILAQLPYEQFCRKPA